MIHFFLWYLVISMIGWGTFPLAYRLLPGLPDRGYTFSRALGLLISGYIFWILVSFRLLNNDAGGVLFAFGLVGVLSVISLRVKNYDKIKSWLKNHIRLILFVEILFLGAFAFWAVVRSFNPDIVATEKPMELAFLNAVLRSPGFPPHDPWLSGFAISYYYFGFILVGMLAQVTFTHAGIAFNLGISLIFALSAVGAYGIIYNLLAGKLDEKHHQEKHSTSSGLSDRYPKAPENSVQQQGNKSQTRLYGLALLGPLFVLIISNLEGLLEILHARGILWRMTHAGEWTSRFWLWLDMKELSQPPVEPLSWMPTRYLWWWRASRVITDYDLTGATKEVIDEFPFFSYLLADLHPHVLAMPFVILAIALALNLFLGGMSGKSRWLWFHLEVSSKGFWLVALILGGLAFLNTWDFPIYVTLISGVYAVSQLGRISTGSDANSIEKIIDSDKWIPPLVSLSNFLKAFVSMGLALGVSGILLYLPFYLTFSSQAGGIFPNLINPTRGAHFWVMFGSLLIPIFLYLIFLSKKSGIRKEIIKGFLFSVLITAGLWGISLLMGWVISNLPLLGDLYLSSLGAAGSKEDFFYEVLNRRLEQPGGWITMLVLLGITMSLWVRFFQITGRVSEDKEDLNSSSALYVSNFNPLQNNLFVILLILFGTIVVMTPEFFFIRDHFGTRMNTVFKFYYQVWLLWAIAAAYGTATLLLRLKGISRYFIGIGIIVVLGAGIVYPSLSLWTKTNGFSAGHGLTLDGTEYLIRQAPDEYEAIKWLQEAPLGVIVEAVGSSYSIYGRVSSHSGQPSILNWPFHQIQWRGSGEILGSRQGDVERIYTSNNWTDVESILRQYDVSYVYIGTLERNTYRLNEEKFKRFIPPVFQNDSVTIYAVPRELK